MSELQTLEGQVVTSVPSGAHYDEHEEAHHVAMHLHLTKVKWVLRVLVVAAGALAIWGALGSQTMGGYAWVVAAILAGLGLVAAVAPRWAATKFAVALGVLLAGAYLAVSGWIASAPAGWMDHELGADLAVADLRSQQWTFSPDGDAGYRATIFFEAAESGGAPEACESPEDPGAACTASSTFSADWYLTRGSDTLISGTIEDLTPPEPRSVVTFHAWAGTNHRLRVEVREPDPELAPWRPRLVVSLDEDSMFVYRAALQERTSALLALLSAALTLALLGAARAHGESHRKAGGQSRIHASAIRTRPRWEGERDAEDPEPPHAGEGERPPRPRRSVPQPEGK